MNVAAYQKKGKIERTGKREAGEERKQSTNFKEAVCCRSAMKFYDNSTAARLYFHTYQCSENSKTRELIFLQIQFILIEFYQKVKKNLIQIELVHVKQK